MKRFTKLSMPLIVGMFIVTSIVRSEDPLAAYRAPAEAQWTKEVEQLLKLDSVEKDPDGAVLFIGSSSIRLWDDLATDMKPWPVIRRGYGGAKFSDLAVFAERIIQPHQFRALAIFVANDVTGAKDDKTPEEVVRLFQHVVSVARKRAPEAPIFMIAITPTPKRWAVWPRIQEVNAALKKACEEGKDMHFISTADQYLEEGQPIPSLFKEDMLHQNRVGYARWSRIIQAEFAKIIPVESKP